VVVPATAPSAPGCTGAALPWTENTRPRLDRCSAHRVSPDRPHRPRSRPVFGPPLRQLASDPFHPVEGGSANDYDYCSGEPVNCIDITGLAPHEFEDVGPRRLIGRTLISQTKYKRCCGIPAPFVFGDRKSGFVYGIMYNQQQTFVWREEYEQAYRPRCYEDACFVSEMRRRYYVVVTEEWRRVVLDYLSSSGGSGDAYTGPNFFTRLHSRTERFEMDIYGPFL
jgi:hypothetical protein